MQATNDMKDRLIVDVLAGGLATGNYTMQLSQEAFNPVTMEGFTLADFHGYANKSFTAVNNGVDVSSGLRALTMAPPSGGFRFTANATISEAQTIHGFRVYNVDEDFVVGGELFPTPQTISLPDQQINVGVAQLSLRENAL